MNTVAFDRGTVGGLAGGVAMAMWSMIVMWLSGTGFWTPLNLIAHTIWRSVPLDGTFSWSGLLVGMIAHLAMSVVLGIVLAVGLTAVGGWATTAVGGALVGMAFAVVVWLVMQYLVWDAIDPAAAERFTPWVFAVGHLMYGLVAGLLIARVGSRECAARTAR